MIDQDKAKKHFTNDTHTRECHQIVEMKIPESKPRANDAKSLTDFVHPGYCNNTQERMQKIKKGISLHERLSLIGEMAAGIGHEIRNPITSVRGFLQLLGGKNECLQYKEYFDLMIGELDRANSVITEFLSLAKDRPMVLKMQNLKLIIEALAPSIIAEASDANMYLHIELEDIPYLLLNENEIKQLILNLVRNGLEAMEPEETLTLRAFIVDESVVISIIDQGYKISSEVIEKMGTPFFSTKDHRTGLGLAECYSIAARHKASIDINTGSNGTTVNVIFTK